MSDAESMILKNVGILIVIVNGGRSDCTNNNNWIAFGYYKHFEKNLRKRIQMKILKPTNNTEVRFLAGHAALFVYDDKGNEVFYMNTCGTWEHRKFLNKKTG